MLLPPLTAAVDAPDHLITSLRQATGQRYRIVRRVGSGGMADVYEARHHLLDRPLAVKVLHSHLSREPEMRVRFKREAEAASRLLHPFIPRRIYHKAMPRILAPGDARAQVANDRLDLRELGHDQRVRPAAGFGQGRVWPPFQRGRLRA